MRKKLVFLGIFAFPLLIVTGGFLNRVQIRDFIFAHQKTSLPEAQPYIAFISSTDTYNSTSQIEHIPEYSSEPAEEKIEESAITTKEQKETEILPDTINLDVPFTPQAPHANWDLPYQEACEEASLLMVARYKNGNIINSPEDADLEIRKLVEFQNNFFGDYKDTTAEETAEIARIYYGFENTEVVYDFTAEDIKKELMAGHPVIVPAAGRQLPNPYFRSPGPLYHMLVIRGYTPDRFITNDPGTKRGEEFVYKYADLLNAVHDWNNGDVENGRKVMIVVK